MAHNTSENYTLFIDADKAIGDFLKASYQPILIHPDGELGFRTHPVPLTLTNSSWSLNRLKVEFTSEPFATSVYRIAHTPDAGKTLIGLQDIEFGQVFKIPLTGEPTVDTTQSTWVNTRPQAFGVSTEISTTVVLLRGPSADKVSQFGSLPVMVPGNAILKPSGAPNAFQVFFRYNSPDGAEIEAEYQSTASSLIKFKKESDGANVALVEYKDTGAWEEKDPHALGSGSSQLVSGAQ